MNCCKKSNDNKRKSRARRNLALKLALEVPFKREIRTYFNKVTNRFKNDYLKNNNSLNYAKITAGTSDLLKKQYIRVTKKFFTEFRDSKKLFDITTKQKSEIPEEQLNNVILPALAIYINNLSKERSTYLDETTKNDIDKSIQEAIKQLNEENITLTDIAIASLAASILKRKLLNRIETIAITETQLTAETVKKIEFATISRNGQISQNEIIAGIIAGTVIAAADHEKDWAAILDNLVRDSHAEADGQKQNINEPFIVAGELLQYPGDMSLGASLSNTINCRCSALYS